MQRVRVSAAMVGGGGRRASMGPTRLAGLDGLGWLEPWYDADEAAGAKSLDTLQTPEEVFGHIADTRIEFEHIADTRRRV